MSRNKTHDKLDNLDNKDKDNKYFIKQTMNLSVIILVRH